MIRQKKKVNFVPVFYPVLVRMADIIKLLPDNLANQIAAGEVVQRPASVVKELLENAIDAGANKISLIIKEAGKTWIQVNDNGCGMSETDARMAFERHATSKLSRVEDLFNIRTMGFRGEALASIAAVAQVELKSKRQTDELGTRILIDHSQVQIQEPCSCPTGTQIIVRNLFFNIPARKNFLKSDAREQSIIQDEFVRIALAHPDCAFEFTVDDKPIYRLMQGTLKQRIVALLHKDVQKNLVPVKEETDVLSIYGFVGTPDMAKKRRGDQYFFVNKRFVQSYFLQHAINSAYESILPEGHYPFYAIFIDIDPAQIDVNVHPTKQEIKFEDEKIIYHYLKVCTRHALATHQIVPSLDFDSNISFGSVSHQKIDSGAGEKWPFNPRQTFSNVDKKSAQSSQLMDLYSQLFKKESPTHETIESTINFETDESIISKEGRQPIQIHDHYILCPIQSGLLIIDKKSALERILYEQYKKALDSQKVSIQQELFPKVIELNPVDYLLMEEIMPTLIKVGFDIQPFGQHSVIVHGIPSYLQDRFDIEERIRQLLAYYKDGIEGENEGDKVALALAKASIQKQASKLSVEEMSAMIDHLFGCAMPYRSPSGKKCFIELDLQDLEQKFR